MSQVLVIAEHDSQNLNPATARAVTCAKEISSSVDVAVLANAGQEIAEQAAQLEGVSQVLLIENEANAHALAAQYAPQIVAMAEAYSHLLAPSTTFGKDLMPRIAAQLGVPQISDIMAVENENTFKRPIYAGNAIVTVEAPAGAKVVGTVRTASYAATQTGGSAAINATSTDATLPSHTSYVGLEGSGGGERPDLQSAACVVSGGRGVGSEDNFKVIYGLADKLGAGVGASRAAVDAGFIPNDHQVGQTGKIIAPDLYFAFGISGAIQHLAGIKDAGTIVAVNKDADAPIFEVADYGIVGDLFDVIAELEQTL